MNVFTLSVRFLSMLILVTSGFSAARAADVASGDLRLRWEVIGPRRIPNPFFRSDKPEQQHLFGSGKVTWFAIHPTDGQIMYAGAGAQLGPSSSGGLHKSKDGGATWVPASRGLTDFALGGLWLNPNAPSVLVACTNDGGIFRTVDGGDNWSLVYRGTEASTIVNTPSGIYASTAAGIVRSLDGGATWRIDLTKPAAALSPGFVDAGGDAIWVRYQNGEVWMKASATAAWRKVYGPEGANSALVTIKVNPRDGLHAITIVEGSGGDRSADKTVQTRDGGNSWEVLSRIQFHDIAFDPARENVLYGGTNSQLMISRDGGATWTNLRLNQDFRLIHTFSNRPGWIAAGGDQGIYLSVDYGETWRSLHGDLSNSLVGSVAVSGGNVLTTAWDYAPIFSFDGGGSWRGNTSPPNSEGGKIFINPRDPAQAYSFNTAGTGLFRSSNGGRNWTRPECSPKTANNLQLATGTLITLQLAPSDKSIAFDPRDPAVVYVCSHKDGIYRSTDRGARFTQLPWPFPKAHMLYIDQAGVFYLGIRPDGSADTETESSLQISRDQGATWTKGGITLSSREVFPLSISVHPTKPGRVILLTNNRDPQAVWSSHDGGRNFQPDNLGLPERISSRGPLYGRAYYYSVEYAPTQYPGLVALASADGVFARIDEGRWIRISDGLSSQVFSQVVWDSGYLYASSWGGGVMRTSAAELYALLNDKPRLANLSVLAPIAGPADSFTLGWVVGGGDSASALPLVVRAVGPSLASFGVASTLSDPKMELFARATKVGENDNWGGSESLATAMSAVGAFSFTGPSSLDSAATLQATQGDRSMRVSGGGPGAGVVLAEVYDATPRANSMPNSPRLLNLSVLKDATDGLTAGFVIVGSGAKRILIRVVGPTLGTAFELLNVATDPRLTLYSGPTEIAANDNWGGGATLIAAFSEAGAFLLPNASRDAALVTSLGPGNYSVRVDTPTGTAGVVLVEVYELP